jgi:hypothetical protein
MPRYDDDRPAGPIWSWIDRHQTALAIIGSIILWGVVAVGVWRMIG